MLLFQWFWIELGDRIVTNSPRIPHNCISHCNNIMYQVFNNNIGRLLKRDNAFTTNY